MREYDVTVLAGGSAFWCVDEERKLRDWIDRGSPRFTLKAATLSVRTVSLDSSSDTAVELRWSPIEATDPWQAVSQAIGSIEPGFPELVAASFLRAQAALQSETADETGRWTKSAPAKR